MIKALNVTKVFSGRGITVRAVDDVSVEVQKGEVVVIEESFGVRITEIIK